MKRYLALIILPTLLVAVTGGIYLVSALHPFQPGEPLYPYQLAAEKWRFALTPGHEQQARASLELAGRRLDELERLSGGDIQPALQRFDQALDLVEQKHRALGYATPGYEALLKRAGAVLASIQQTGAAREARQLGLRVRHIQETNRPVEVYTHQRSEIVILEPVVFPADFDHRIFPLRGSHQDLPCQDCHLKGAYAQTGSRCSDCHEPPDEEENPITGRTVFVSRSFTSPGDPPAANVHYPGACSTCHQEHNWTPLAFDHQGEQACTACHAPEVPYLIEQVDIRQLSFSECDDPIHAGHYPGSCDLCHWSAGSWREIIYQHKAGSRCEDCHAAEAPQGHYPGLCADCHPSSEDWQAIEVIHPDTFPACITCHRPDVPERHYNGSCSLCHNTQNWEFPVFVHEGTPVCQDCHKKPAGHFGGSCSDCHTTTAWLDGAGEKFRHNDPQCSSCHIAETSHYPAECSTCHTYLTWTAAEANHDLFPDCDRCHTAQSSHYPGQCSDCHSSLSWTNTSYQHTSTTACTACHAAPAGHYNQACSTCHGFSDWLQIQLEHTAELDCGLCHAEPAVHYLGLCTDCHTFKSWTPYQFDHTYYHDCLGCHLPPTGHWPGQCSDCHIVSTWSDYTFDHTLYTDCKACHKRPDDHRPGQCSKCHVTTSWTVLVTPTPLPTPISPSSTPAPTATLLPTASPEITATPTPTPTATWVPADTETPTPTSTAEADPTETPADPPTATNTPEPAPQDTPTPTATATP